MPARSWPSSWSPDACSKDGNTMANILTFIEISPSGQVRNSAAELSGAAAKLGTPTAVVVVRPGTAAGLTERLGALGASHEFIAESDEAGQVLITPQVAGVQAAVEALNPAAVLAANSVEGREVAARLSLRTGSGVCIDAVDVRNEAGRVVATHSVFGGGYTVDSTTECELPIITVRQGAIQERAAGAEARSAIKRCQPMGGTRQSSKLSMRRPCRRPPRTAKRHQGRSGGRGLGLKGEVRPRRRACRCARRCGRRIARCG